MLDCKGAGRLISEALDRDLGLGQRAALRLHLLFCTACSRVKSQLAFLHRAAGDYPGSEDNDSRQP